MYVMLTQLVKLQWMIEKLTSKFHNELISQQKQNEKPKPMKAD